MVSSTLEERPTRTRKLRVPEPPNGRKPTRIKDPLVDRVFMVGVYILLTTFLLVVLLPLIYIVASSFSDPQAVSSGRSPFGSSTSPSRATSGR